MNVKTAVEQLAGPIGKEIGASDDHTQAALLNGFCEMLEQTCRMTDINTQLCFISDKLTHRARLVIIQLAEFCETSKP